jgi:hypothetical protein
MKDSLHLADHENPPCHSKIQNPKSKINNQQSTISNIPPSSPHPARKHSVIRRGRLGKCDLAGTDPNNAEGLTPIR